jgi:anti-anti-sigma regulatory factor
LKKACEAARAEQRNVVLDFTDVVFVDRAGATLIRKLMDVGLLLSNCSPFVSEQLKQPLSEKGAANSE